MEQKEITNKGVNFMYHIIGKRGTGKTLQLMLLVKENNGILVCKNPSAMKAKAISYGLVGFDIISYTDFFARNYDLDKPCFIDEIDAYLKTFNNTLLGYSLNLEDDCL